VDYFRESVERVLAADIAQSGSGSLRRERGARRAGGDQTRFKQILLNLVSNAVKFSNEGGEIVVAARRCNDLVFSVQDGGIGIKPRRSRRCSSHSKQAPSGKDRNHGGVGLGWPSRRGSWSCTKGRSGSRASGQGDDGVFKIPMFVDLMASA